MAQQQIGAREREKDLPGFGSGGEYFAGLFVLSCLTTTRQKYPHHSWQSWRDRFVKGRVALRGNLTAREHQLAGEQQITDQQALEQQDLERQNTERRTMEQHDKQSTSSPNRTRTSAGSSPKRVRVSGNSIVERSPRSISRRGTAPSASSGTGAKSGKAKVEHSQEDSTLRGSAPASTASTKTKAVIDVQPKCNIPKFASSQFMDLLKATKFILLSDQDDLTVWNTLAEGVSWMFSLADDAKRITASLYRQGIAVLLESSRTAPLYETERKATERWVSKRRGAEC